jgi:hypothetical protein
MSGSKPDIVKHKSKIASLLLFLRDCDKRGQSLVDYVLYQYAPDNRFYAEWMTDRIIRRYLKAGWIKIEKDLAKLDPHLLVQYTSLENTYTITFKALWMLYTKYEKQSRKWDIYWKKLGG